MPSDFPRQLLTSFRGWWRENAQTLGARRATSLLLRELWEFARDSTPDRRRSRYGDMEYDWEHRVNTTSGAVGWRERLLGMFHTAYQPTDPGAFREMISALPIDFTDFTFIDIGSGKGRTLLMASEYPFLRVVGVEIFPALNRIAEENIRAYQNPTQRCFQVQTICADAREFELPEDPLVLYLFNPLPEAALRRVIERLETSLRQSSRPVWIVYHNPLLASAFAASPLLEGVQATTQYSLYRAKA